MQRTDNRSISNILKVLETFVLISVHPGQKFEAFFESYKLDKFYTYQYSAIFMIRRLIFIMVCIYFEKDLRTF